MRSLTLLTALGSLVAARNYSLEVLYVQDVSESFAPDLDEIASQIPGALRALQNEYSYTRVGLATFVDRPEAPYGSAVDYCYRLRYPLTLDVSHIEDAMKRVITRDGGDVEDCQLTALAEAAKVQSRWTDGDEYQTGERILKFVVLATDSPYHEAGDYPSGEEYGKRKHQDKKEVNVIDYPAVSTVKKMLQDQHITPVFITKKNILPAYMKLSLELGGYVFELDDDSSNLMETILQGLHTIVKIIDLGCDGGDCPDPADVKSGNDLVVHFDHLPRDIRVALADDHTAPTFLDGEFTAEDYDELKENPADADDLQTLSEDLEPLAEVQMNVPEEEFEAAVPEEEFEAGVPEREFEAEVPEKEFEAEIPEEEFEAGVPEKEFEAEIPEREFEAEVPEKEFESEVPEKEYEAEEKKGSATAARKQKKLPKIDLVHQGDLKDSRVRVFSSQS